MAGLYIHVPFCHAKCWYCDFYSTTGKERTTRFVDNLEREWTLRRNELDGDGLTTVYFGGGTPSILSPENIRSISRWIPREVNEVTIEVNPEDVTAEKVALWRELLGVNRVSMGVQSLIDGELAAVGRRHTAVDALNAVNCFREGGIENISLDLIYGLPGQTVGTWNESLDGILRLRPDHLSAYILSYEPGTRLDTRRQLGKVVETDEETIVEMYKLLCRKTREAGYEHYEISNFALDGRRSRHNSSYWTGAPYLGLGPGAHSFDGKLRRINPRNLTEWGESIEKGMAPAAIENESLSERTNDTIMVRLRTADGLRTDDLPEVYRHEVIKTALSLGPDRIIFDSEKGLLRIPESGWLVSDDTISTLFV